MTAEDLALREEIANAISGDERALLLLIANYWRDQDRSERTPRHYFYFDLGLTNGVAFRLLDQLEALKSMPPATEDQQR